MTDTLLKSQAFKLKGRFYTFTVLKLLSSNVDLFASQLGEVILKAPKLFDNTPVVIDCSGLEEENIDLEAFFNCMKLHSLVPVAIQAANPLLTILAQAKGIAVLHASSTHDKAIIDETHADPIIFSNTAKIQTTPVRSGQQVVCKGGDLIITASVSHGAELLADGNIHVYGALRGRALAGISGDTSVRIFCHSLDAELLSIAGFYRLSDAIEHHEGPCQIYLQDEHIHIDTLC